MVGNRPQLHPPATVKHADLSAAPSDQNANGIDLNPRNIKLS
ncbi:MAG: hypothetical protein EWM72_02377 [Nitrospira sp.]|nr:MAG: hypothetical protein EWM72_02377 [Nitrospira sp.]